MQLHANAALSLNGRRQLARRVVAKRIDDATRLTYAEVLPDETAATAIAFLKRATAFYARHGIHVE